MQEGQPQAFHSSQVPSPQIPSPSGLQSVRQGKTSRLTSPSTTICTHFEQNSSHGRAGQSHSGFPIPPWPVVNSRAATRVVPAGIVTGTVAVESPPSRNQTGITPSAGGSGEACAGSSVKRKSTLAYHPGETHVAMYAPTCFVPVSSFANGVTSNVQTAGGTSPEPSGSGASVPNGVIVRISSRFPAWA